MNLKEIQKTVKDLILFNTVWNKKKKIKSVSKKVIGRIAIYRDLVRNSLFGVISNIYPNTKNILNKHWNRLLTQYLEAYPPGSPILNRVAEYLPEFLSKQKSILKMYPFITELAKYEWLELDIYERNTSISKSLLNPVCEICNFNYPIPAIIKKIENKKLLGKIKPQKTSILIYRDPKTLKVRFFELTEGTSKYLELLEGGFPDAMIKMILAHHFKIKDNNLKKFNREINKLVEKLTKNRILIKLPQKPNYTRI